MSIKYDAVAAREIQFVDREKLHRQRMESERKQAQTELRHRFAMAALTGLLAYEGGPEGDPMTYYPKRAYKYADAMLAECEKVGGE
jgi:2,4-dienoyl-CoA reductase-like NADH-dependent reductase (Old Yellow Enzyme family)